MERREQYTRQPLGKDAKKIEISAEEMHLVYRLREVTGEPIQTWIRRMIREQACKELEQQSTEYARREPTEPL